MQGFDGSASFFCRQKSDHVFFTSGYNKEKRNRMAKTKILLTSGSRLLTPAPAHPHQPPTPKMLQQKYGKIFRMNIDQLIDFIKSVEKKKIPYNREEYTYAKKWLEELTEEKRKQDEKKELEKQKEIKKQEKQKAKEKQKQLKAIEKAQKLEDLNKRKAELSLIGNLKIKECILEEFEQKWERMSEEERIKKINRKKSALSNIDFVKGKIRPAGSDFMTVHITYLTDKGVILLRGLYNTAHVFYSPNGDSSCLTIVLGLSEKAKEDNTINKKAYLRELSKYSQEMFGEPTVCRFTFDYFKDMVSKYYLYYEERDSKGTERANIPSASKKKKKKSKAHLPDNQGTNL